MLFLFNLYYIYAGLSLSIKNTESKSFFFFFFKSVTGLLLWKKESFYFIAELKSPDHR